MATGIIEGSLGELEFISLKMTSNSPFFSPPIFEYNFFDSTSFSYCCQMYACIQESVTVQAISTPARGSFHYNNWNLWKQWWVSFAPYNWRDHTRERERMKTSVSVGSLAGALCRLVMFCLYSLCKMHRNKKGGQKATEWCEQCFGQKVGFLLLACLVLGKALTNLALLARCIAWVCLEVCLLLIPNLKRR